MASKLGADAFLQFVKARRTIYPLTKNLGSVTTGRVQELVREATLHTPSSFNSQSNRLLVLFGTEHDKLWDITRKALKAIVPEANWSQTETRIAGFQGAAGTILFFDDEPTVQNFQSQFPPYADKFPIWANQSNAIQQFILWTALEVEGLGANLQHYNPLIDQQVAAEWKVPASWKLNAQLVFGGRGGEAGEKEFKPVEERVKVFGA